MRLAGVGLLGVTHANSALEAVQRLIGKVELGMISQVLDTVIHIEKGQISQVLELKMVVRAPSGMESDLSRPVIEVRSFPSNKMTHEIFSFGEQIVVVPVDGSGSQSPAKKLAAAELARRVQRWTGARVHHVEMASDTAATIFVDESAIGCIVGQGGSGVRSMEEEFGLKIKVKGASEMPRGTKKSEAKPRNGTSRPSARWAGAHGSTVAADVEARKENAPLRPFGPREGFMCAAFAVEPWAMKRQANPQW